MRALWFRFVTVPRRKRAYDRAVREGRCIMEATGFKPCAQLYQYRNDGCVVCRGR